MTRSLICCCCEIWGQDKAEVGSHMGSCCRLLGGEKWSDSVYVLNVSAGLSVQLNVTYEQMEAIRDASRVKNFLGDE